MLIQGTAHLYIIFLSNGMYGQQKILLATCVTHDVQQSIAISQRVHTHQCSGRVTHQLTQFLGDVNSALTRTSLPWKKFLLQRSNTKSSMII